jgi:hypothetical protein
MVRTDLHPLRCSMKHPLLGPGNRQRPTGN